MSLSVKVCGIRELEALEVSVECGVDYLGFVFFSKSPRNISASFYSKLARIVPKKVAKVGLFVDPDDQLIDEVLSEGQLDFIQLHGNEAPSRVLSIKEKFSLPIIKAFPITNEQDFECLKPYYDYVDKFLFDSRPPKESSRPGGNAVAFDWRLMSQYSLQKPWLLAGGLNSGNLSDAVKQSGCKQVDVSSGVERSLGIKDPYLIKAFITLAKTLS